MSKVIRLRKIKSDNLKKVKNKKTTKSNNPVVRNKYKIILLLTAIFSILAGSLIYNQFSNSELINEVGEKIIRISSMKYAEIFALLLKSETVFFLLAFFIGTSFIGAPLSVIPVILKCVFTGFMGGYMYNCFALNGVLFCLLFVFPYSAVVTTSLIFASNESIYMSLQNYKSSSNAKTADNISVRLYLLRYLVLAVIVITSAAVNSVFITLLADKINLY